MKIFFSEKCLEYSLPGHPESPERVRSTYQHLKKKGFEFQEPAPCDDRDILRAHTQQLLDQVRAERFFDLDTPSLPGIFEHARLAAGSALDAAALCQQGEVTFSLMRPPGHHATKNSLGGFCYFNNIAVASSKMKESTGRIAIIDFDCHHGNGTEDIFYGSEGFLFLSLHQSPLYPGTGLESRGNCLNYPIAAGTPPGEYLSTLKEGLLHVQDFDPHMIAVSAGFDSYVLDPITSLALEKTTYREIGLLLAGLEKPLFAVLEGGYSRDIPECIEEFLIGLDSKARPQSHSQ